MIALHPWTKTHCAHRREVGACLFIVR